VSNTELFEEWLIDFKKTARSGEDNPMLLILDNHTSHISLNQWRLVTFLAGWADILILLLHFLLCLL
jgi:hypothetical protein